ncbi:Uronate dehydrogenase [bacterium HR17]|uniref:Uronate dehydrogenase n=1 Tax=Candidatus Fervidibacter japonicus TaxID=2035412 RepID=A0A2H5XE25_9BACT|nr:Uronate dehydrogenase [bacterium HR17]
MRVCFYGAGGPVAAAAIRALEKAGGFTMRLTDLNADSLAPYTDRHETMVVDVTDFEQVSAAAQGMDALVNCTVIRHDIAGAFRVNAVGAYNIMRAAVAHGVRRVVQTGPYLAQGGYMGDYAADFDIPDDAPPRPGVGDPHFGAYFLTKFLGQEICRVFAETYDITVVVLLFVAFYDPNDERLVAGKGVNAFCVSWDDAGEAFRCALTVPALPRPFEVFHILADLPHGKFTNHKAKTLLHWQPNENFARYWRRSVG